MTEKAIAISSGLLAMAGWGVTDIFAKKVLDKVGDRRINIYTSLPALIITAFLCLFNLSSINFDLGQIGFCALIGFLDLFAYLNLFRAYTKGKVSIINPISSAYTIPTILISTLIFDESLALSQIGFMALIILGVMITAVDFKELRDGLDKKDLVKGLPQGLTAALSWGIVFPLFDLALNHNPWFFVSFVLTFSKVVLLILYNKLILKQNIVVREKGIFKPLLMAGLTDGGANLVVSLGFAYSTLTSITAVLSSAYPLILVPAAAIFLKEKNAPNQYFGVAMITLGIIALGLI